MPNRISERLRPIEYWQNKKKQFMAGGISDRRIWLAFGLASLALLFSLTVAAGIFTARSDQQARHIPLRPLESGQLLQQPMERAAPAAPAASPVPEPPAAAEPAVVAVAAAPANWPADGAVSQDFGWQEHPVFKDWRYHNGIDIAAAAGQPVTAAISGRVSELRQNERTGLTIVISAGSWRVYHGSLATAAVKTGEQVVAGQLIGAAGESPREPYPHVHLAIEKNGKFVNPVEVLPSR